MLIEFDPAKNKSNLDKHGVPLSDAQFFKWETAIFREDARKPYAEQRWVATGYVGARLHVLVYCLRGQALRPISLRKANRREEYRYAKT